MSQSAPAAESAFASASPTPPIRLRGLVTREELRAWRQPSTARAIFDVSLIWVQIFLAIGLYVAFPNPLTFVLAFVLVGGAQHGLPLAAHEFAHYNVFPRNRALNDRIGTWFFAAPALLPFALYRHRHFKHHRTYSSEDDTKTNYRSDWKGMGLFKQTLRGLSGYEFADHIRKVALNESESRDVGDAGPGPLTTLPPMIGAQLVLIALFATVNVFLYLWLWILPLVTLSYYFNKVRATKEHQPLDAESGQAPGSGYFKDTPGPFVRSVEASWLERLFVCKINFSYHAAHHVWPQISYQYLPIVHQRMLEHGCFDDPRFGLEATYTETIRKLWREPEGT